MKRKLLYIGNQLAGKGRTPTTIDHLAPRLENLGLEVVTASSQTSKLLRMAHMLWSAWCNARKGSLVLIDTYSTANFWYAVWVARICRYRKCDYIPYLHGGNLPKRLQSNPRAARALFGKAKVNVSPSPYLQQQFAAAGYDHVMLIPNYINLQDYEYKIRTSLGPKILWVRSFAEIYNPMMALKVLEKLLQQFPAAQLCMVGPDKDGSLYQCQGYAQERELEVRFTGKLKREEWIELANEYDIFINTSHFDNMPVSVIEAMALGLPVVSTQVGGMPYLIQSGREGILVPDDDAQAMVEAITGLLGNPAKAREMSAEARKMVEQLDWEVVKQQWRSLLME